MSIADFLAKLTNVTCKKCQYKLGGEDLMKIQTHLEEGILLCPRCQSLIGAGVSPQFPTGVDKASYRPTGAISYNQIQSNEIFFSTPWRNKLNTFIFIFGLAWLVITMPIIFLTVFKKQNLGGGLSPEVLGSLFGLIGISLAFWGLLSWVNRRNIKVNYQGIFYSDGPLWTSKETAFLRQEIKNLRVRVYSNGTLNDKPVYQYAVDVCLASGEKTKICSTSDLADAVFIEYSIEKFLGLKDDQGLDRTGIKKT
jgi:hypothetical protein